MSSYPGLPGIKEICKRLERVFPEGTGRRNYLTREMAAKTVFVMLYCNAVEGTGIYVRPDQVTKMTDVEARKRSASNRKRWCEESLKPGGMKHVPKRWYQPNTREPIRDECLKDGLIRLGAVSARADLPTTSSKPRYCLCQEFAKLFVPTLKGARLTDAIAAWQKDHLSSGSLARIRIAGRTRAAATESGRIEVKLPNGEVRTMAPGPSSVISKDVIEVFATRFLDEPALVWLSESSSKAVYEDRDLAHDIGLEIREDRILPDVILADVAGADCLFVFVEVVASDGPVTDERRQALLNYTREGGFREDKVVFVTAFADRGNSEFRKLCGAVAWDSFIWCASEPGCLMACFSGERIEGKTIAEISALGDST